MIVTITQIYTVKPETYADFIGCLHKTALKKFRQLEESGALIPKGSPGEGMPMVTGVPNQLRMHKDYFDAYCSRFVAKG